MNLNEVISLSQHTDRFDHALQTSISNALRLLAAEQGSFEPEENHANLRNDLEPLVAKITPIFYKDLREALQRQLNSVIRNVVKSQDKTSFLGIWFKPMTASAYADRRYVYMNEKFIDKLSQDILDYFHELVLDNDYDSFAEAFFKYVNAFAKLPTKQKQLFSTLQSDLHEMSSLIVHELVHTRQHTAQISAGRDDYEYRSYLDKYKGHLNDLNDKDDDSEEFYHLYYASPQEISAFAHTITVNLIHDFGLDKITHASQIKPINGETIVARVNAFLDNRYKLPSNPKEYQVYKRYLKLVYIELQNYINNIKSRL